MKHNGRDLLIRHEGVKLKPYLDTVGKLTIGVGRNLDALGISRATAEQMLDEDIARARAGAEVYPWFAGLNAARQAVVVDMIFNLGRGGFRKFTRTKKAISNGHFRIAALEMQDSRWYRQVGTRGVRLAKMMRTGKWPR